MLEQIKLFQTQRVWAEIGNEVIDLVNHSHFKGQAQNGEINLLLERTLAQRFNRRYCITTACCTDALTIALTALDLGPDAGVAVSNYTFTASAHAIARAGYQVAAIDINDNYCINPDQVQDLDAVVSVDLFGNMSDYRSLKQLGIPIIVDAAQSLESQDADGRWSAEYGVASCISFSPSKTISSWGSGGAILTNDEGLAKTCRKLRLHGKVSNDHVAVHPGLNSMMSSMECASVLVGLKYADQWHARRQQIAEYLINFSRHPTALDTDLPKHTYSKLVFQSLHRDQTVEKFYNHKIDCVIHYNTLINNESLYCSQKNYNKSDYLKSTSFTVPNQHTLTDDEVERIAKALQ